MSKTRQLVAIMFTDIVGFTELMGNDEQKTFEILEKNRQIHKPIIDEFDGKFIKELGDGVIASFNTVSDAVNAAIKIQETCSTANDFELRIGIHQGEVVFEDDDVFGDGVNIAARIQTAAEPGCIFISESVNNNISNKKDIKTHFVKEEQLKNVSQPIRLYQVLFQGSKMIIPEKQIVKRLTNKRLISFLAVSLILAAIFIVPKFTNVFSSASNKQHAIAVLPFVNMSDDDEQEYFSDGISEEIINVLAQVPDLKVMGRTSSFAFKGKNMDLKVIGEQLNVNYLLEGSVRRSDSTLRITAQLINVADGSHIYSDKFDRELADIFDIQDEISAEILSAIKIKLLGKEKEALLKNDTENVEAYQLLLKGRYHYNKFTPNDLMKAIEYYKAAIAVDSNYSLAHAEIANCYGDTYAFKWLPKEISYPQATAAAEKAIQLDDNSAESHIAIARNKLWFEWDFTTALQELNKGLKINPNSIVGNRQMSILNLFLGNNVVAYKHVQKADELDPFSLFNLFLLGAHKMQDGNYESMLEYGNRLVSMEPNFHGGHLLIGIAELYNKQNEAAIKELELAATLTGGRDVFTLGFLGLGYGYSGNKVKAMEVISKLGKLPYKKNEIGLQYGLIYASISEWDKAFEHLDDAIYVQDVNALYIPTFMPLWFPEIKDDPKMKQLIRLIDSKIK